jgi:hypothetical protein
MIVLLIPFLPPNQKMYVKEFSIVTHNSLIFIIKLSIRVDKPDDK